MSYNNNRFITFLQIIGDFFFINLSFLLAYFLKFDSLTAYLSDKYFVFLMIFNISWFLSTYFSKAYKNYQDKNVEKVIGLLIRLFILHVLLITTFWVFRKAYYFSREHLILTYGILIFLITTWRFFLHYQLNLYKRKGLHLKNVIIVGSGQLSKELYNIFESKKELGYKFFGFFSDQTQETFYVKGKVEDVSKFCKDNKIDEIYCSISDLTTDQLKNLTSFAHNNLIRIKMIPDVRGFLNRHLKIDFYDYVPVLTFRNIPLDDYFNRIVKRSFDFFFSIFVIIFIMSWLYPVIAILIKLSSKGPVLFKQARSGKNNDDFKCWKFRTMYLNEDSDNKQASLKDNRVTSIGSFLRRTSIDEMPQFFNVLFGYMSIVGPRPHMLKHTEIYSNSVNNYMFRHFVKPGITGLAQVKGLRGETKYSFAMDHRIKLDMMYIQNWSFILDIKIISLTIINSIKKDENAY